MKKFYGIKEKEQWSSKEGILDEKSFVKNKSDFNNLKTDFFVEGDEIFCKEDGEYYYYSASETKDTITGYFHKSIDIYINTYYRVGSYFITEDNSDPNSLFGGTWEKLQEGQYPIIAGELIPANLDTTTNHLNLSVTPEPKKITAGAITIDGTSLSLSQLPSHKHNATITGGSHQHSTTASTSANGSHSHTWSDYYNYDSVVLQKGSSSGGWQNTSTTQTSNSYTHSHTITISNASANVNITSKTEPSQGGGATHTHTPTLTDTEYVTESADITTQVRPKAYCVNIWRRIL